MDVMPQEQVNKAAWKGRKPCYDANMGPVEPTARFELAGAAAPLGLTLARAGVLCRHGVHFPDRSIGWRPLEAAWMCYAPRPSTR
jgi:hypothetical protein